MDQQPVSIKLEEGRYARLESIGWWDQKRIQDAKVLVVGAGALGNEVLKNFALLGLGQVIVVDMDQIELSNLTRSVLFRSRDEGEAKAISATKAMKDICPDISPIPIVGNLLADVGLGFFRWADIVVGALDNREARVFVNSSCALVGRPWVDGGIDVLQGIVRGFNPPQTACYECTMSQRDWDLINERRSCSLIARKAFANRGTPTTPTTASVIGAIQTQEVVKYIHDMKFLSGQGYFFDGISHQSYSIEMPINPDCEWHEEAPAIESIREFSSDTPLEVIAQYLKDQLGGLDAIDLSRELVGKLTCPNCGAKKEIWSSIESIDENTAICKNCAAEMVPEYFHSLGENSEILKRSAAEIGLPKWDILFGRYREKVVGIGLEGDNPFSSNSS